MIVAADVKPRALVAHLDSLCASRGVAMLSINGGDGSGSLKLGELFGTRTAIAVGIKVRSNLAVYITLCISSLVLISTLTGLYVHI